MAAGGGGVCQRSCIKAHCVDQTILALFFQSDRIGEWNHSLAGDRKHMNADSRRGDQSAGLRARHRDASVETITVFVGHMVEPPCRSCDVCMCV